jgi:hypothetical protein
MERISKNWDVLSFLGALIGGIISGLFTYLGVIVSNRKSEKDRFLDTYDIKKTALEDAIFEIKLNFVNIQHLEPYNRIVALCEKLTLIKDIIGRLKEKVGGTSIRGLLTSIWIMF